MIQDKITICPICSSPKLGTFDLPSYSQCKNCEIVFQNPIPTEAELAKLYENYYQVINKNANVGYENYEENRSPQVFEKNYLTWIERYVKDKSARLLDFGCGTGNLLIALRNNGYANIEGCEFASDAFPPLREKKIHSFFCRDIKNNSQKYGAVLMIDVVEHLRDPKNDILAISASLEKGGYLFIETINIDDFLVKYFHKKHWMGIGPAHIFLVGKQSLRYMLAQAGLSIVAVKRYKLSGSFIKWVIIRSLSLFSENLRRKYKKPPFQFTLGDGIRIVAQKTL